MNNHKKKSLREEQSLSTRRKLVDAALHVFAEKGFAGSTITDVGNVAGVSPGLIYHYFDSKEAMLNEIIEQNSYIPEIAHIVDTKKNLSIAEFLCTLALNFHQMLEKRPELILIFIREGKSNEIVRREWKRLFEEVVKMFKEYLDQQIANGRLKQHSTEVTAHTLGAAVIVLRLTEGAWPLDATTGESFIRELVNNLLKGIERT